MRKSSSKRFAFYMEQMSKWFEWFSIGICIICGASLFSITFAAIIFRYALHSPFRWSEELARMILIWMVFFGGNIVIREGRLLKLDFFENIFPSMINKLIEIFSGILGLIFLAIVFYTSLLMTKKIGSIGHLSVIRVSIAYPYLSLPAGAFLMIFQIINNLLQNYSKK